MGDLTVSAANCLHFFALQHGGTRTAGIDRNEEITSLSPYVSDEGALGGCL